MPSQTTKSPPSWDFLTNHAHVLVCVAHDPGIRLRDIATAVGITERAAHRIVSDLVGERYLVRTRVGRRNQYEVKTNRRLRHPLAAEREVGELLGLILGTDILDGNHKKPAGKNDNNHKKPAARKTSVASSKAAKAAKA